MSDISDNRLSTSRRERRQIAFLSRAVSLTESLDRSPSPAPWPCRTWGAA